MKIGKHHPRQYVWGEPVVKNSAAHCCVYFFGVKSMSQESKECISNSKNYPNEIQRIEQPVLKYMLYLFNKYRYFLESCGEQTSKYFKYIPSNCLLLKSSVFINGIWNLLHVYCLYFWYTITNSNWISVGVQEVCYRDQPSTKGALS